MDEQSDMDMPMAKSLSAAYEAKRKAFAQGGMVSREAMLKEHLDDSLEDKYMPALSPMDESDDQSDSIVDRIMKKKSFADGGLILKNSEEDNGKADLGGEFVEPRMFDERNHSIMDEDMDQPIEELSYPSVPSDKNPHDEDDDSILSRIRRKMRK